MPEVSENAAIFIAQSHQAEQRAKSYSNIEDLQFCDSIVCLIFACFYIEETLNVIKELDRNKKNYLDFFKEIEHPGLFSKMCWFYNKFISEERVKKYKQFGGDGLTKEQRFSQRENLVFSEFKNFKQLRDFRDNLSHGIIQNDISKDFKLVQELRQSAKDIVCKLLLKSDLKNIRTVYYKDAVKKLVNENNDGD